MIPVWAALLALYPQGDAGADYINRTLGFRFTPPTGWKSAMPSQAGRGFLVSYVEVNAEAPAPKSGGGSSESDAEYLKRVRQQLKQPAGGGKSYRGSVTVMATRIPQATLDEYAKETRAVENKMAGSEYRFIAERRFSLSGVPALERTARLGPRGGSAFMTREALCLRKGRLISVSMTAPYGRYKTYFVRFRRMLDTFQWLR